jgi:PleD family two-component response regulator
MLVTLPCPKQELLEAQQSLRAARAPVKLLIVEDEPKTAAYLKKGLGESGFTVDIATDGECV